MEHLDRLEIYIPVEAEVKSIPISSLPSSVIRRMGLMLPDSGGRRTEPPAEGIWICPAVLRRKGQRTASDTGSSVITEDMSRQMSKEFRTAPGPFQMSFVSSNHAAYRVLKDTMPGKKASSVGMSSLPSPAGLAPQSYQDAVVIYRGRIYLSIRKPGERRGQRETRQPEPSSSAPSTATSSNSQKESTPAPVKPANREPAKKEQANKKPQKKRLRIPLPQINRKKDLLTKTVNPSTTNQLRSPPASIEPANGEPLNKRSRVTSPQFTPKNDLPTKTQNRSTTSQDVSSSRTSGPVPQCTDSGLAVDASGPGDADTPESTWFQPQGDSKDLASSEQAQSSGLNDALADGDDTQMDSSILGWSRAGSGAASTSAQQECDFKELEQEEEIAQMMAKYRECEAALDNMPS